MISGVGGGIRGEAGGLGLVFPPRLLAVLPHGWLQKMSGCGAAVLYAWAEGCVIRKPLNGSSAAHLMADFVPAYLLSHHANSIN